MAELSDGARKRLTDRMRELLNRGVVAYPPSEEGVVDRVENIVRGSLSLNSNVVAGSWIGDNSYGFDAIPQQYAYSNGTTFTVQTTGTLGGFSPAADPSPKTDVDRLLAEVEAVCASAR